MRERGLIEVMERKTKVCLITYVHCMTEAVALERESSRLVALERESWTEKRSCPETRHHVLTPRALIVEIISGVTLPPRVYHQLRRCV